MLKILLENENNIPSIILRKIIVDYTFLIILIKIYEYTQHLKLIIIIYILHSKFFRFIWLLMFIYPI